MDQSRKNDFTNKRLMLRSSTEELAITQRDAKVIMKFLGIVHAEAMGYQKYGIMKERYKDGRWVGGEEGEEWVQYLIY